MSYEVALSRIGLVFSLPVVGCIRERLSDHAYLSADVVWLDRLSQVINYIGDRIVHFCCASIIVLFVLSPPPAPIVWHLVTRGCGVVVCRRPHRSCGTYLPADAGRRFFACGRRDAKRMSDTCRRRCDLCMLPSFSFPGRFGCRCVIPLSLVNLLEFVQIVFVAEVVVHWNLTKPSSALSGSR